MTSIRRIASRARWIIAIVALGAAAGCAGILGLDEVSESSGPGDDGGIDGTTPDDGSTSTDGPQPEGSTDAGTDAPNDAPADRDADTGVDAGCNQTIATDFTNVALPPQVTMVTDGIATITFDNMGVGNSRAAHVLLPITGVSAELVVNISSLANDGAKKCAVSCSIDVRILQRGGVSQVKLLTMEQTAAASTYAALVHSDMFTYFGRSPTPAENPDLGATGNGVFTTLTIDVSGNAAPFSGKANVGAATNTKQLTFFPASARIGLAKVDVGATVIVEAIFDNLVCKSHN
jgi:hypothetical protein